MVSLETGCVCVCVFLTHGKALCAYRWCGDCVCVCVCVEGWVGDTKCIKQMIDDFHSYTWWRSLCSLSAFLCSHPIQLFSSLSLQSIPSPLPLSPSSFPALRIIFLCLICFCLHLNPSLPFNLLPSSDFTCIRGVAWRLVPPPPPLLTHWSFCHLQFEDYFRHLWSDRHYIAEIEKTASETRVKSTCIWTGSAYTTLSSRKFGFLLQPRFNPAHTLSMAWLKASVCPISEKRVTGFPILNMFCQEAAKQCSHCKNNHFLEIQSSFWLTAADQRQGIG